MMNIINKNNMQDISIMRIVATCAVIFLHTCNTISNNMDNYKLTENAKFIFTTGNYIMNWAVPVFLMITGALLLRKEKTITYRSCITKYTKRIILALFIFGIPFSMMESILDAKSVDIIIIPKAIFNVFTGNSWSHLWYLYTLVGIYLILPLLKAFVDKANKKDIEIILVVMFVFNFILPLINSLFDVNLAFKLPVNSFTVFYILLGYYLYYETKVFKKACIGILIGSCILIVVINKYFSYRSILLGYSSPLIVVTASMIFCLLQGCKIKKYTDFLWRLDRLCFGAYLVHPVFINFLYKFLNITPINAGEFYPFAIVIFWIFFILCSFLSSLIMSKIKILKKYVL